MRLQIFAAAITLAIAATPSVAQTASQDKPAPSPDQKKICRAIVPTGSIMAKRVCLTRTEWGQFDEANSKAVNALLGRPKANNSLLGLDL